MGTMKFDVPHSLPKAEARQRVERLLQYWKDKYGVQSNWSGDGAKVNGKIVPLRYKLKNGDTVEVLTSPQAHPSKDWLTFVKTSRAQQRIRAFIKQQQRDKSLQLGRELLERELKRYQLNFNRLLKNGELKKVCEELGFRVEDDLLVAIGYGKVVPNQVLARVVPPEKLAASSADSRTAPTPESVAAATSMLPGLSKVTDFAKKLVGKQNSSGVQIGGVDDVLVRFGRCCNPVPGDPIAGFITRGRGVTVHTVGCDKALATDPERRVDVSWDVRGDFKRPVTLRVLTTERTGIVEGVAHVGSVVHVYYDGDEKDTETFLIATREEKGRFTSFEDFLRKCPAVVCNKRTIESLIKAGAFDSLGSTRRALMEIHEDATEQAVLDKRREANGEVGFDFDSLWGDDEPQQVARVPERPEWTKKDKLAFEREMLGLYVSDHPLAGLERKPAP